MGKRSNFERVERDFYPTPYEAVLPLIPHLHYQTYVEPCAGDGALVDHLDKHGIACLWASDIEPRGMGVRHLSAFNFRDEYPACDIVKYKVDCFITNPPWSRDILHPLIEELSDMLPTWLLFDADWMHTKQSIPYLTKCEKIVSVGRVKWIPDSTMTGKDNCCWYLFQKNPTGPTKFYGRTS